eukprot:scaffold38736_cov24-Attheya_sp.AAC.1
MTLTTESWVPPQHYCCCWQCWPLWMGSWYWSYFFEWRIPSFGGVKDPNSAFSVVVVRRIGERYQRVPAVYWYYARGVEWQWLVL